MNTFTSKQLDRLTECITCREREIEADILMYKSIESPSKDVVKRMNDYQTEYFDLKVLWSLCHKLEREARKLEEAGKA